MRTLIKLLLFLFACLPVTGFTQAENPNRSGFFGGIGYLNHTNFFIFTKWGSARLDVSASSPHIILGYIHSFSSEKIGLSVTGGASWFNDLPDFGIELFPDAPVDMRETKDYSNIKLALYTMDLSLVFFSGRHWEYDIAFTLGVQSNSETHYELEFNSNDPSHPQKYRIIEGEAFVVAGAGFGVTYGLSRHFFCTARARLIVGEVTGSGYALYVDGQKVGDPYGKTAYMKQLSLGLTYRL